jgi:hypothetical protein
MKKIEKKDKIRMLLNQMMFGLLGIKSIIAIIIITIIIGTKKNTIVFFFWLEVETRPLLNVYLVLKYVVVCCAAVDVGSSRI